MNIITEQMECLNKFLIRSGKGFFHSFIIILLMLMCLLIDLKKKHVLFFVYTNFYTDIDECLSSDNGCTDECVNVDGGYHCACPNGYRLDSSRRTCVGKFWLSA